jgi:hypothetical protein
MPPPRAGAGQKTVLVAFGPIAGLRTGFWMELDPAQRLIESIMLVERLRQKYEARKKGRLHSI